MPATKVTYIEHTDIALVKAYKQTNDTAIIGILMERYTALVLGVCMKYLKDEALAKDMVMQVFENLFADLKKHTVINFQSWLYTVTKNNCLLHLRKDKQIHKKKDEYKRQFVSVMENEPFLHPESEVKEQLLLKLEDCISKLNAEQKTAIELFFFEDKSYREVAQITGYSLNEVKSYVQNGKRNLKQCITANEK